MGAFGNAMVALAVFWSALDKDTQLSMVAVTSTRRPLLM